MMTVLWAGLSVGALYSFVALGYSVTYLGASVFNFAQASLLMVGVFIAYWGLDSVGLAPPVVIVVGVVVVAALAVVQERIAIRPARSHEALLMTTLGAATLIDGVTVYLAGDQPHSVPFFGSSEPLTVLGGKVLPVELLLIFIVAGLGVVMSITSRRTLIGLAGLAVAADSEAALLYGISPRRYSTGAFLVAGVLAGAMGVFIGPKTFAYAALSSSLALKGFVGLAFGGFGSLAGATLGGFLVGVVEAFSARYLGTDYQSLAPFALLLITLLCFPGGIFGSRRVRVV